MEVFSFCGIYVYDADVEFCGVFLCGFVVVGVELSGDYVKEEVHVEHVSGFYEVSNAEVAFVPDVVGYETYCPSFLAGEVCCGMCCAGGYSVAVFEVDVMF